MRETASSRKERALGSIGGLGSYSFHETKNYICGEGGGLCINDPAIVERAEIIMGSTGFTGIEIHPVLGRGLTNPAVVIEALEARAPTTYHLKEEMERA